MEKLETRTRTVVETEAVDVEEMRCSGPCGDFYPDEELRSVVIDDGSDGLEVPVCVYCCESLWGVGADETAGTDLDSFARDVATGFDLVRRALLRLIPPAAVMGLITFITYLAVEGLSNLQREIASGPPTGDLGVDAILFELLGLFPIMMFIAAAGVIFHSLARNA